MLDHQVALEQLRVVDHNRRMSDTVLMATIAAISTVLLAVISAWRRPEARDLVQPAKFPEHALGAIPPKMGDEVRYTPPSPLAPAGQGGG